MINFNQRSYQQELLDQPDIPTPDLIRNLKELAFINTYLGGHNVTVKGLKKLLTEPTRTYRLIDIGCGGGDTLKYIARWGRKKGLSLQLTGVDLKADCIAYAQEHCKDYPEIDFIQADYRDVTHLQADVFTAALFCHHLPDDDLINLLRWMDTHAKVGFVINDLHRHSLAYYSIRWLTRWFSRSYLVKNDACLSVWRSFKKEDWRRYLAEVPSDKATITWQWAFRWLIVGGQ
ncbi:MAG: methyltransferase domain-containing protein [Bacteroidota bacterium]